MTGIDDATKQVMIQMAREMAGELISANAEQLAEIALALSTTSRRDRSDRILVLLSQWGRIPPKNKTRCKQLGGQMVVAGLAIYIACHSSMADAENAPQGDGPTILAGPGSAVLRDPGQPAGDSESTADGDGEG